MDKWERKNKGVTEEELEKKCEEAIERIMVDDRYFIHLLIQAAKIRLERLDKR